MPSVTRVRPRRALIVNRGPLLVVLAAAVGLAACVPSVIETRTEHRADAEASRAAAGLGVAQRGVRVTTTAADDMQAQLSTAAAVLAGVTGEVEVISARLTYPLEARPASVTGADAAASTVVLAYVADLSEHVELVEGRAPRPAEVVEVVAPRAAGIQVGERLLIGSASVPVQVVGTWEPWDRGDPLWYGDPGLADGTVTGRDAATGPLFTADDAAVARAAERPRVQWTVVPDVQDLTAEGLARVAHRLEEVPDVLAAAGVLVQGATIEALGGPNLSVIADAALASRHRAVAAFAVGMGVSAFGLLAAAGAFGARTRRERELLRARGASSARLVRREAVGVLSFAAVGGSVGWGVAAGFGLSGVLGLAAGAAALGAGATLAMLLRWFPVDAAPPGRPTRVTGPVLIAALVVATVLATWRLVRSPDDGLAVGAAALLLTCAGLVSGFLAPVAARACLALTRRARGLVPLLATRRVRREAGPLPVIVALAAGAATFAVRASDDPALRTAWTTTAGAAVVVGALAFVADSMARRDERRADDALMRGLAARREGVLARRAALAAALVTAGVAGGAVAAVTARLVLGSMS